MQCLLCQCLLPAAPVTRLQCAGLQNAAWQSSIPMGQSFLMAFLVSGMCREQGSTGGSTRAQGVNWGACLCTSWACPQQYVLLQAFSAPPRPLHPRLHCLYLSRRLAECREDEPVSGQLPDCWLHLPAACCPDDVRVSWVSHQGCPKAGCCPGWVAVAGRWEGQFKAPAKEGCEHPSHRSLSGGQRGGVSLLLVPPHPQ